MCQVNTNSPLKFTSSVAQFKRASSKAFIFNSIFLSNLSRRDVLPTNAASIGYPISFGLLVTLCPWGSTGGHPYIKRQYPSTFFTLNPIYTGLFPPFFFCLQSTSSYITACLKLEVMQFLQGCRFSLVGSLQQDWVLRTQFGKNTIS